MHAQPLKAVKSSAVSEAFSSSQVMNNEGCARLCRCVGSPEPSWFAYVISILFTWADSFSVSLILGEKWTFIERSSEKSLDHKMYYGQVRKLKY